MFCVQRNQMWINDGTWQRNWVCAFRASNHPQLHAVIELSQLNPSVETFSAPQAAAGDTSTNETANPTTCGVTVEAASVLRPGKGCPADSTRYIGGRKRDNYQGQKPFLLVLGRTALRSRSLIYCFCTLSEDPSVLLFLERSRLWQIAKLLLFAHRVCMGALRSTFFYG